MKKIISVILAFLMVMAGVNVAFAQSSSAKLYGTYGDNMLFQQNKDAVFAGTATSGAEISAELYNAAGELVASGKTVASDGVFAVSFVAPAGGYDEYKVILNENGIAFAELEKMKLSGGELQQERDKISGEISAFEQ